MKMYKAERFSNKITEMDIESQTENFVIPFGGGGRVAKTTSYDWIRPTREEAKKCLIEYHKEKVERAKRDLKSATEALNDAMNA